MREYARTEIIREKCHYCGCKNKLFTDIERSFDGVVVGMTLRCCNCGNTVTHLNPSLGIDIVEAYINKKLRSGKSKCIQESYCPHTQCPLYGTCGGGKKPPKDDTSCNCRCIDDKLLDTSKLVIKSIKKPRFR